MCKVYLVVIFFYHYVFHSPLILCFIVLFCVVYFELVFHSIVLFDVPSLRVFFFFNKLQLSKLSFLLRYTTHIDFSNQTNALVDQNQLKSEWLANKAANSQMAGERGCELANEAANSRMTGELRSSFHRVHKNFARRAQVVDFWFCEFELIRFCRAGAKFD